MRHNVLSSSLILSSQVSEYRSRFNDRFGDMLAADSGLYTQLYLTDIARFRATP